MANDGSTGTSEISVSLAAGAASDTTAPQLIIQTPTGPSVITAQPQVTFAGTAADASNVTEVTWSNGAGGSGTATPVSPGFAVWRASIPLSLGYNTVIIRARDGAGNSSWRSLSVTR